jgi:hypothetical protein
MQDLLKDALELTNSHKVSAEEASHLGALMYKRSKAFLERKLVKCQRSQVKFSHSPCLVAEIRQARLGPKRQREQIDRPTQLTKKLSTEQLRGFVERNYKIKQLPQPLEAVDLECVFEPQLNERSLRLARALTPKSLYTRGREAALSKEVLAVRAAQLRSDTEMQACTFSPVVRSAVSSPKPRAVKQPQVRTYAELRRQRSR